MEEFIMKENKNILKGDKQVELKVVRDTEFYITFTTKDGSFTATHVGTRMEAKNALYALAKKEKGQVTYFGAFTNK
jgi:hypothetical protein